MPAGLLTTSNCSSSKRTSSVALCFTIPKMIFMLTSILLKLIRRLIKRPIPHGWISLAPALFAFGYVLFGAIKGKENFQVKEVTFYSPNLPDAALLVS
jgi:hypothetical protein